MRWELGEELPGSSELRRYRLRDLGTDETMELWEPRASVRLRPGVQDAIAAATRSSPSADAALSRIPVPTEQGKVLITRSTQGCLADREIRIGRGLHPSPASPVANRGWAERAEQDFAQLGIEF